MIDSELVCFGPNYRCLGANATRVEAAKFAAEQKAAAFSLLFPSPRLLTKFGTQFAC